MNTNLRGLATAFAALLLTACSPSAPQTAPVIATPAPASASQRATTPDSIPSATHAPDRTADFTTANASASWVGQVKSVTETEPGTFRVHTSVVDPRGANGSEVAMTAIAICESVVGLFGPNFVSVLEDDGTNFVLFGHPSVPVGACTEV
ncbi:hypothetical protein [Pseudarthrobacter sp. DSP2-3-2b1]|uniref:hypothetical protein n=1 Tax=Pseudarthrobacter sp. DSP2-3-2b1 TaxID=2804661 RepID=UPI003CF9E7A1